MTRRTTGFVVLALGLLMVGTSCSSDTSAPPSAATAIEGARTGGSTPGSLLTAETLTDLDPQLEDAGVRAAKVTYRSTNSDTGQPTVVSGTVFVPDQEPPAEGWRIVSLGHGSTGITTDCAPSASTELGGQRDLIASLVKVGLAVTMADFEGLGSPGPHPYLAARTAGLNVIDAVRAARSTFDGISTTWAAVGGSQGGGAVWAADEQAGFYAPELQLVGTVALVPAADVSGLVDRAVARTLSVDQRGAFQWFLASAARLHPDLVLDDFRRGAAAANWDLLSSCDADSGRDPSVIGIDDLTPSTPRAAAIAKRILTAWALPQGPLTAPLLVAYGGKDSFIDPQWTAAALARACRRGGTIQARFDPEGTHGSVRVDDLVVWLADRFAGKPATSDCPKA